ncbi:hypothetical protein KDW41_17565 [Burkholderia vietnamiensis]|nr:hypothetical protein [Burkholderia vietnamiensis]
MKVVSVVRSNMAAPGEWAQRRGSTHCIRFGERLPAVVSITGGLFGRKIREGADSRRRHCVNGREALRGGRSRSRASADVFDVSITQSLNASDAYLSRYVSAMRCRSRSVSARAPLFDTATASGGASVTTKGRASRVAHAARSRSNSTSPIGPRDEIRLERRLRSDQKNCSIAHPKETVSAAVTPVGVCRGISRSSSRMSFQHSVNNKKPSTQ